jgi:endonuclease-8
MSEGPEVHRIAMNMNEALAGANLLGLETRLKKPLAWLEAHSGALENRQIFNVFALGKNIIFQLNDDLWFRAHPLMWGKWQLFPPDATLPRDPAERVHLYTDRAQAIFLRGQVFDIVLGDPFEQIQPLREIGPDICDVPFDVPMFKSRLLDPRFANQEIAPVLLLQEVAAGLGNYFKSDVLNACRISPWRLVRTLSAAEIDCLATTIPMQAQRSITARGFTIPLELYQRLEHEAATSGRPFNYRDRHWAFRRSGRPCFHCGAAIKQTRTGPLGGRLTYYCPICQPATSYYEATEANLLAESLV